MALAAFEAAALNVLINVKEIADFVFCNNGHVQLGEQIVTGIEGHMPHSRPHGHQPGMLQGFFLYHVVSHFVRCLGGDD